MVAADEYGQNGRQLFATVVLVERAHALELFRHGHAVEVVRVARRLEVAAAQQQIHLVVLLTFDFSDCKVDLLQFAVGAALDGDSHVSDVCSLHVVVTAIIWIIQTLYEFTPDSFANKSNGTSFKPRIPNKKKHT